MALRAQLIKDVLASLHKAGFATSDPKDLIHSGFDIVARRGDIILIVKVVLNANSIADGMLAGMKSLASAVEGSCIIIAAKAGNDSLEDGVTYSRSGIPLLALGTFNDLVLEGVPPLVYAASGGYYVNVDSEVLRKARQGGVSLGDMAEMAGVSRRTIKMYEDGMGAKMEVALRLEEGLGVELILPVDPLRSAGVEAPCPAKDDLSGLARDIFQTLDRIGYSVTHTTGCPFDAVSRDGDVMLFTGVDRKSPGLERRAKAMAKLTKVLEKRSVMFVDRLGVRVNIEGTPLVGCSELKSVSDKRKVVELIEEREA